MVVVAGDDHQLAVAKRLAELGDHRPGDLEHLRQRAVAQLEHVAEQDEAVDLAELAQQPRQKVFPAQQVRTAAEPEVQVRDDRREHGAIVAPRAARLVLGAGSDRSERDHRRR